MPGAIFRSSRRIERKIDAGLSRRFVDLVQEPFRCADELAIVVGHVDDRGHTSRRGAFGGPDEVLLTFLAAAMNLRVDGAGKDEHAAPALPFTRRSRALPDPLPEAVRRQNV